MKNNSISQILQTLKNLQKLQTCSQDLIHNQNIQNQTSFQKLSNLINNDINILQRVDQHIDSTFKASFLTFIEFTEFTKDIESTENTENIKDIENTEDIKDIKDQYQTYQLQHQVLLYNTKKQIRDQFRQSINLFISNLQQIESAAPFNMPSLPSLENGQNEQDLEDILTT